MQDQVSNMFDSVKVKVPGKLFLAGEYGVTKTGGLAIVSAIESDFIVGISEMIGEHSRLHTNVEMVDFDFSLEAIENLEIDENSAWNFVLTAIQLLCQKISLDKNREIYLDIQSGLGYGEHKKGYGSSASSVVGVVKAFNRYFKLGLSLEEEFQIASQAHLKVQGSGSLGDVAAITYAGNLFYRSIGQEMSDIKLPWLPYILQTDKAANTGEKLKIELSADFYERSNELVIEIATAADMTDFELFKEKVLQNQLLLIEHLPEGYMTEALAIGLNLVNSQKELVGKISGAGFGENILVFAKDRTAALELEKMSVLLEEQGIHLVKAVIPERNT